MGTLPLFFSSELPYMKKIFTTFYLITSILLCQSAGLIGSFFTISQTNTWYKTLVQPSFVPPSWLFGPVWIILYTLMGIALFLLWQSPKNSHRTRALTIFFIQLALNAAWTPIFFGLHAIGAALVFIIFLLIAIAATIWSIYTISRTAGYLLVPYCVWVLFATMLNTAFWILN